MSFLVIKDVSGSFNIFLNTYLRLFDFSFSKKRKIINKLIMYR